MRPDVTNELLRQVPWDFGALAIPVVCLLLLATIIIIAELTDEPTDR